jgi:prophage regulatory protein
LTRAEVLRRVGVTYPTVWQWMKQGRFPLPREISDHTVRWIEAEIHEWMLERPVRKYSKK